MLGVRGMWRGTPCLRDMDAVRGRRRDRRAAGRPCPAGVDATPSAGHGCPGRTAPRTPPKAAPDYLTACATARPAVRPENRQPPRNVPSSDR